MSEMDVVDDFYLFLQQRHRVLQNPITRRMNTNTLKSRVNIEERERTKKSNPISPNLKNIAAAGRAIAQVNISVSPPSSAETWKKEI